MGKEEMPLVALNPMLEILKFEWFMYYLKRLLVSEEKVNVFIVHNPSFTDDRKKYGVLMAAFHTKRLVEALKTLNKGIIMGEYEANKLIIISTKDIELNLVSDSKDEIFNITTGATASIENDNEFSIMNRALKALTIAQRKKINFQTL